MIIHAGYVSVGAPSIYPRILDAIALQHFPINVKSVAKMHMSWTGLSLKGQNWTKKTFEAQLFFLSSLSLFSVCV